jgi:hypothetical protein
LKNPLTHKQHKCAASNTPQRQRDEGLQDEGIDLLFYMTSRPQTAI